MAEQPLIPGFDSLYLDSTTTKKPRKKALPPRSPSNSESLIFPENIEKAIALLGAYEITGNPELSRITAAILTHRKK